MKKKLLISTIAAGVIAMCLTIGAFAGANLETINVYLNKDVQVKLNGQLWQPMDSTGASTYPITYNGTTWLPVKSIGDVLGAKIGWDAAANSVLINGSTNSSNTTFVFTKDHPEKTLISLIVEAKSTLDIAIYSLTHPDIIQAIKDAKARGVLVRIITDKIQASGRSQTEALKILGSAGIPTMINSHSGLMHLKVTIVDNKTATSGSYNYSKAASAVNDEVLIVMRDESIAKSFTTMFDTMWNDTNNFTTIEKFIAMDQPAADPANKTDDVKLSAQCEVPTIKGNLSSGGEKIYHVPGGAYYDRTIAEQMFCSAEEAQTAGFRASSR